MKFENIKELISLLDQSSLTEFEFQENDVRLRLSKNDSPSFSNVREASEQVTASQPHATTQKSDAIDQIRETVQQEKEEVGRVITSPIVGVIYLQPSPDSEPYFAEGDQVSEGQVLCLVEAMKIMNEIKAEFSGQIVEILVENEEVVEYNQPLFRIV